MPLVDILVETYNKKIKKYKRTTQAQAQTADTDGGANKPGTGTDTADADADGGTNPGTQQTQTEERMTQVQPQTQGQAATASDGKVNRNIRQPKFISFSINNISSHSEKLTNDRTGKKDDRINATTATATATATPDVLNLSVFLSTIDQIILSNLQP